MENHVLLIDVGNSRTKAAYWNKDEGVRRGPTWQAQSATEIAASLLSKGWIGVVIAAVGPSKVSEAFLREAERIGMEILAVNKSSVEAAGVDSGLYEGLGADRLANLAALCSTEPLPALCIDAGTAVTFDFLDSDKNFLGGLIAPGQDLMVRALTEGTKLLPHIESTKASTLLGTDTISAIRSGCWWGGLGMVEGILRILKTNGVNWKALIVTGGLCHEVSAVLPFHHTVEPDFTFKGMSVVWEARNSRADSR